MPTCERDCTWCWWDSIWHEDGDETFFRYCEKGHPLSDLEDAEDCADFAELEE